MDGNANSNMENKCRFGCGFFGNPATEGLCSVCYKEYLRIKQLEEGLTTPRNMASPNSKFPSPKNLSIDKIPEAAKVNHKEDEVEEMKCEDGCPSFQAYPHVATAQVNVNEMTEISESGIIVKQEEGDDNFKLFGRLTSMDSSVLNTPLKDSEQLVSNEGMPRKIEKFEVFVLPSGKVLTEPEEDIPPQKVLASCLAKQRDAALKKQQQQKGCLEKHTDVEPAASCDIINEPVKPTDSNAIAHSLDEPKESITNLDPATSQRAPRCALCRKKLGLTGVQCRCGGYFCGLHRYSDRHNCTFDYRQAGAEEVRRNNPAIVAEKIKKL